MALYHPYLDNPIWHKQSFEGKVYFPSYPKSYDERYFVYCEFAYQALYNFWDRIGDRLSEIIPTNLKVTSIDFARVIDAISLTSQFNDNIHFSWICNYKNNEYKLMNEERKQLVHYESVSSQMHLLHMDSFTDRIKIEERQNWIEGRVNFFINHFQNCVEGIRQLTMFIETK